jgi:hypothetical protein
MGMTRDAINGGGKFAPGHGGLGCSCCRDAANGSRKGMKRGASRNRRRKDREAMKRETLSHIS